MNAGAYSGELGAILRRALVATSAGTRWLTPAELGLRYRHSDLHHGQVVAAADLELEPRPVEEIRARVAELQRQRKQAQPTNKRTFGSVFKNPQHDLSAGRMLDACGLRGTGSAAPRSRPSMRTSSRTSAAPEPAMRSS